MIYKFIKWQVGMSVLLVIIAIGLGDKGIEYKFGFSLLGLLAIGVVYSMSRQKYKTEQLTAKLGPQAQNWTKIETYLVRLPQKQSQPLIR